MITRANPRSPQRKTRTRATIAFGMMFCATDGAGRVRPKRASEVKALDTVWKDRIARELEILVDKATTSGAEQAEVFATIEREVARLRQALLHDPDPAEDGTATVVDEPANDWPAADGHQSVT